MRTKNTKFIIVGGGLSGLIFGMNLSKLDESYILVEKNEVVPEAKLHYLHEDVSEYLPFKLNRVDVITNVLWNGKLYTTPTIDMMNYFSYTTLGRIMQNSMKFIDGSIHNGWIPEFGLDNIQDKIKELNKGELMFGANLSLLDTTSKIAHVLYQENEIEIKYEYLISTIPLPAVLKISGIMADSIDSFKTEPIKMTEVITNQDCFGDMFEIVYIPQAEMGYARFSILGKRIVAEKANGNFEATESGNRIGLNKLLTLLLPNINTSLCEFKDVTNWFGRYIPIDETERNEIISELNKNDIYPLGRYAEWTYKRVDHVVKDAEKLAQRLKYIY